MNEFYKRMNIPNSGKIQIVERIVRFFNNKETLVLDLGAGSCVIERLLMRVKFKGSIIAIERNEIEGLSSKFGNYKKCEIVHDDLFSGTLDRILKIKSFKTVVVVLSAILHELTQEELYRLAALIKLIGYIADVNLIVREPLATDDLIKEPLDIVKTNDYFIYKGLHKRENWSEEITFINYCFLKSYGEQSWDREKFEGRFTFTYSEMKDFIEQCGCEMFNLEFQKDEFYKKTLPYGIFDKIKWTGTSFCAKTRKRY